MAERIQTAAVLGAGVMGRDIAAHLAGAGIRTHLLDIIPKDAPGDAALRNRFAQEGIQKALKAKPAAFFKPEAASGVTPGNFDDHLPRIGDCDLVIEAVVEKLEIKNALFKRVLEHLNPNALLASNTSGLSIEAMAAELPEALQSRFLIMHFFNPVRYMHLLELVPGPKTSQATLERAKHIGEYLGKGVVLAKDTPNFIANRIGVHGIMQIIHAMEQDGYTIEEVDKIVGQPMGRPKSAAFRTTDLVGLDTFAHVADHCYRALPHDEERDTFQIPTWVRTLIDEGRLGQKAGAGFYKKEGKNILVLDPKTGAYRAQNKVRFDSLGAARNVEDPGERLKGLIGGNDRASALAWKVLARTMNYSARRIPEIADNIVQVDRALRWGFNWDLGPFEAWDAIGVQESASRMEKEGIEVPKSVTDMLKKGRTRFYEAEESHPTYFDLVGSSSIELDEDTRHIILKRRHANHIVKRNLGASLVDLGDGCLCLEVHTKMNTIDGDVITMLEEGVAEAEHNFEALIIGNEGTHFGAGANLMLIYMGAQQEAWDQIESVVQKLQQAVQRIRYAQVPIVAAPFQYTFGGCAELAMAADACQAHAETYMGLVEVGAGLIPAGGGCLRMVERWTRELGAVHGVDYLPFVGEASLNIATAKVSTSAEEARRLRYLLKSDGISLNRDHLLYHAKNRALGMARSGYRPPLKEPLKAAGLDIAETINMRIWGMVEGGWASEHDALIAKKLTHVLCGGRVAVGTPRSEQDYLDLEREAFLSLCGEQKTKARIESLLMTNKPLRN